MNAAKKPPVPANQAPRRVIWLAGSLLMLATLFAYGNSLTGPFIFDDKPAIIDNPTIRQLWPLTDALNPPAIGSGVTGRPIVNLSLALNLAISGEASWSYHAFNLITHGLAGLALFGLVRRTLQTPGRPEYLKSEAAPLAAAVAVLWLLHPLQTESVTSIIQRTESLMGLFYLLTLYGFIRGVQSPRPTGWLGLSIACCLLGMGTKEVMVSAPLLVLLYDRTFVAGTFHAAWQQRRGYYLGLAATWLLLGWLLLKGGGTRGDAAGFGLGVTPWTYALTQCKAIGLYLKLTLWPQPLVFDYGTAVVHSLAEVWPQALLLIVLTTSTVMALWRRPVIGFLGAAFFAILAPSSSVVPLVSQTIAEHRMYLPLAAVIALLIVAVGARFGRITTWIAVAIALLFVVLTLRRNRDYHSELAIWTDTVTKLPDNARARVNLAEILINTGQPTQALEHASEAVRLRPGYPEAQTNLGIALAQTGRSTEALLPCRTAIDLNPRYARGHSNLAVVLAQLGQLPEAIQHLQEALRLAPESPDVGALRINLGNALLKAGRLSEAIAQYTAVLELAPTSIETRYRLGIALGLSNRLREAEVQMQAVLNLQPDHAGARGALEAIRAALP